MTLKTTRNFSKILTCLFLAGSFCANSFQAFAQKAPSDNYVVTEDVVKEIEKTLLFNKESGEKVNAYQKKGKRKSDMEISHGKTDDDLGNTGITMSSTDVKIDNFNAREKEKLAYNASLIGQYEVAIELYKQVLTQEPNNVYSKFALAVIYQKIGQLRQSKTLYYELLKNNVDNKEEVIGNLLAILVEESPKDAVYLLSRLTAQNPESSYILAQAALAYDKIKNYDQAIEMLKRAISFDQDRVDYKYNLAIIYDKTANYERALESYSDVVKNYNTGKGAQAVTLEQVQKRIEFLRNKE